MVSHLNAVSEKLILVLLVHEFNLVGSHLLVYVVSIVIFEGEL